MTMPVLARRECKLVGRTQPQTKAHFEGAPGKRKSSEVSKRLPQGGWTYHLEAARGQTFTYTLPQAAGSVRLSAEFSNDPELRKDL